MPRHTPCERLWIYRQTIRQLYMFLYPENTKRESIQWRWKVCYYWLYKNLYDTESVYKFLNTFKFFSPLITDWKSWLLVRCHRDKRLVATDVTFASGRQVREPPIKKCAGVKAFRWKGSDDSGVIGREFKQALIRVKIVFSSSYVNKALPKVLLKWPFMDLIAASHNPPKCGERGGMNFHFTPTSVRHLFNFCWCGSDKNRARSSFNRRSAPTKLVPLSEWIILLKPRLAQNLRKATKNALVLRSLTNSMWTALKKKHINTHM